MRFLSFHVDGFGILHDTGIDALSPGLTVILGDNGAGKSTLLEFVRALLFGFRDGRTGRPKYEPLRGGLHGGRADVEMADGHRYRIARGPGGALGLETVVSQSDGAPDRVLASLLGGATRDVFENVFAFSLSELQEVGTLDQEAVKARLYAAGAGTGARSLPKVRDTLDKEARGLYAVRSSSARLVKLAADIRALRERQAALGNAAERYALLQQDRERLAEQLASADREEAAARSDLAARQALLDAWPDWSRLVEAHRSVAAYGQVRPVPDGAEERLKAAHQTLQERTANAKGAADRLARSNQQVMEALTRLGSDWTEDRVGHFDAGTATEQTIASMAQGLAEAARGVDKAEAGRSHAEEALKQAASAREALEAEEQRRWPTPPRAMDSIESDIGTLREARAAATRLAEERAGRATIEARRQGAEDDLKRLRVAPEPVAQTAHIPLFLAIGLLAGSAALVSFSPVASGALFALFIVAAAVAIRLHRKARSIVRAQRRDEIREAEGRLKDVEDKLAAADESIAKQRTVLNRLGALLGLQSVDGAADLEPVEERLTAERDSARAFAEFGERLRGARKNEAAAADARDAAQAALDAQVAARSRAERDWVAWLEEHGMPPALRPEGALQFIEQVRAAQSLIEERNRRMAELKDAEASVALAREALNAVIAESGDDSEEAFLQHVARWRSLQEAVRAEAGIRDRLVARAGSEAKYAELEAALSGSDAEALTAGVQEAQGVYARAREHADALRTRDGEIGAEMRSLEASVETEAVARELAEKVSMAEEALEQWAVRRLCIHLLDEARLKFERERQPAVIRNAGDRLRAVTDGTYTRLIRRLDGAEIEAEHKSGDTRSRPAWNRGLLEQIYLCLRLGYIEDYASGAEPLPIVMDDVLANFDPDHAARTARMLVEFAEKRQVIYLTCHPETVAHFRSFAGSASGFYTIEDGNIAPGA